MPNEKNVEKSNGFIELSIDRVLGSLSINMEALKATRSKDNRGYATYNVQQEGEDVAIAGANGEACQLQLLIVDGSKKSKGKAKANKKIF